MIFSVTQDCYDLGLRAGAIVFRDVRITAASPPELQRLIDDEIARLQPMFPKPGMMRLLDEVTALHTIYRSVGVNPRREQPSNQRLMELTLKLYPQRGITPDVLKA